MAGVDVLVRDGDVLDHRELGVLAESRAEMLRTACRPASGGASAV